MRLPRLRFTLRTAMVLVAVAALALIIAIPVGKGLFWLYHTPLSAQLTISGVDFSPIRSANPGQSPQGPFPVGAPVQARCSYHCEFLPSVPAWVPFHMSVVTNLMNPPFTVVESQRESHVLVSGVTGWKSIQGEFTCPLTPRRSGYQMVQYEVILTDVFGKKRRVALHTNGFEAK